MIPSTIVKTPFVGMMYKRILNLKVGFAVLANNVNLLSTRSRATKYNSLPEQTQCLFSKEIFWTIKGSYNVTLIAETEY